jgi:hypothetical protein
LKFGIEISMLEEKSLMVLIVLGYTIKNQHLNFEVGGQQYVPCPHPPTPK